MYTVRYELAPDVEILEELPPNVNDKLYATLVDEMRKRINREFFDALMGGASGEPRPWDKLPTCGCGAYAIMHRAGCPFYLGVV